MNKTKNIIMLIFLLIFLICSYLLLKQHHEKHMYDINKTITHQTYDYGSILRLVFEKSNWNDLPLSENFRNKYKTKFDIVDNAGRFVSYGSGYTIENSEELLIISYDVSPLFDLDGSDTVTTWLYFRYSINDNKLLDDVELVRIEKNDAMTGKKIEM